MSDLRLALGCPLLQLVRPVAAMMAARIIFFIILLCVCFCGSRVDGVPLSTFQLFNFATLKLLASAFDADEFDVEDECCVGRNGLSCAAFAVSEVVGNEEAVLRASGHELYAFGPAGDDTVEGEYGRFAAAV